MRPFVALLLAALAGLPARAAEPDPDPGEPRVRVSGFARLRVTLYEQMQEVSGITQKPQGDAAAGATTGFSVEQAHLRLEAELWAQRLALVVEARLESGPALLDTYGEGRVAPWLRIRLGQQRVPSAWENLEPNRDLDFILRTGIAGALADYALSRTTYASSLFQGNRSYRRDAGLALAGDVDVRVGTLRYLAIVGNGLGANLFIGGASKREHLLTNAPQVFWGARLDLLDLFGWARVGGHVSRNRHDDVVYNSGRVVYDLDRTTWSVDAGVTVPGSGVRLHGMYGWGAIDDDYDDDGKRDHEYRGAEARLVWGLGTLLALATGPDPWQDHPAEIGARYDWYAEPPDGVGFWRHVHTTTVGATWPYRRWLAVQINGIFKRTDHPATPDLDDDALLANVMVGF